MVVGVYIYVYIHYRCWEEEGMYVLLFLSRWSQNRNSFLLCLWIMLMTRTTDSLRQDEEVCVVCVCVCVCVSVWVKWLWKEAGETLCRYAWSWDKLCETHNQTHTPPALCVHLLLWESPTFNMSHRHSVGSAAARNNLAVRKAKTCLLVAFGSFVSERTNCLRTAATTDDLIS